MVGESMSIYDFGVGGYDLEFYCYELSDGQSISVVSDIGITTLDCFEISTAKNSIVFLRDDTTYSENVLVISLLDRSDLLLERYIFETQTDLLGVIRIIFHNEFITVYINNNWIHTFAVDTVYHPEEPKIWLNCNTGTVEISDVRLKELADWREAIYVDLETTGQNAISSVVLQRPVEITPNSRGNLVFQYGAEREQVELDFVTFLAVSESEPSFGCSDALVQFTKAAAVNDIEYAKDVGFVTRLLNFSDLDNGAIAATRIVQRKGREQRYQFDIVGRFHPSLELGDVAKISKVTGNNVALDYLITIESVNINQLKATFTMTAKGRKYLE